MAQVKLPRVDANALAERLRDVDLSRLAELGDEFRRLDVAEGIRSLDIDALRRLDVEGLRHLADGVDAPEFDLAALRDSPAVRRVQRMLGREPKRNLWDMPNMSATIIAGSLIVLAGAAVGGAIAWLFQPGKGDLRRARLRRKGRRLMRKLTGAARPA
jgi:hypothetical protein